MLPLNLDSQTSEVAQTTNYTGVDVKSAQSVGLIVAVTVTTPSAGTFTADSTTDIMSKATHGFKTGLKVQVSNSGGALPTGLSAATDYFVIYVAADTFKLATSLVNANLGTAIDLTTNGTGLQTVTPTSIAGATLKLQGSMDDSTYADLPIEATGDATKSASITATANFHLGCKNPGVNYVRVAYTMTAGQISIVQQTLIKG